MSGLNNTTPSLNISNVNLTLTNGVFNFLTNTNGQIYYSLRIGYKMVPLNVVELQTLIKTYNLQV
jgi:hypothetical protein